MTGTVSFISLFAGTPFSTSLPSYLLHLTTIPYYYLFLILFVYIRTYSQSIPSLIPLYYFQLLLYLLFIYNRSNIQSIPSYPTENIYLQYEVIIQRGSNFGQLD